MSKREKVSKLSFDHKTSSSTKNINFVYDVVPKGSLILEVLCKSLRVSFTWTKHVDIKVRPTTKYRVLFLVGPPLKFLDGKPR